MIEKDDNFCYKGIYYCFKEDVWYLFDDYISGNLMIFNKDYRLDECIEKFKNESLPFNNKLPYIKWSIKLGRDKPWMEYEDYLKKNLEL